jgi:hypothetical protein
MLPSCQILHVLKDPKGFVQKSVANRSPVVAARRALARVAIGELGRPGAAVARYLGAATSTANRAVGGALDPLAQRGLGTLTDC